VNETCIFSIRDLHYWVETYLLPIGANRNCVIRVARQLREASGCPGYGHDWASFLSEFWMLEYRLLRRCRPIPMPA
jgi:hypothetical protein